LEEKLNLTSNPIGRLLKQIAIPASIGSLFQTLFNLVDTFFAGKISSEALAALAKSFPLYFLIISAGIGIVAGCNSLIANCLGARNKMAASIYSYNTLISAVLFSIVITFIGIFFSYDLLKIMGNSDEGIKLAKEYTDIIFLGSIVFLIQTSFNAILYSQGDTKSYRNFLIVGLIFNIILNPIFIFGLFFIPAFGIAGLAISTILIQFVGCVYLFLKVNKTELKIVLKIENFFPRRNFLVNIFYQVIPITFSLFLVAIGSFILLFFISIFGDQAIAGYGVGIRFEHLFTLPVIGLNTAVISIAGQNFGARRFDRIREVYFKAILIGVIIMCFAGVTIYLFSESIVHIFSNDLEVIEFGSQYLKIAAFIIPIYPVFFISNAFFTAVKKTSLIFYSNLFRLIVLPAIIVWIILNIFDGEFQDIFFGLLYMNWIFGFFVLLLVRIVMINKFYEKKKFFFFI
jgi:putative MATE family efflux protein